MQMIQVEFQHLDRRMVVWVDAAWNLKVGNQVDFVDGCLIWKVTKVYKTKIDSEQLYCKWGLDLPKTFRTEI